MMMEPASHKQFETDARPRGAVTIRLSGVSKYYAGVRALEDVSVEFYEGEVHAILGENGAGKSTLMGIISGALQPSAGEISFGDRRVSPLSPERSTALGIAISFQHPAILDDLSVLENFQAALPPAIFREKAPREVARTALDAVGLHVPLRTRADALTVAQKHLLEIAKALAIKPKVLIFDEPTASLDQEATDMLFGRIREVVSAGTSVIYITHRMAEVRAIAQRVTVLRDGRVRGVAPVAEISDADVLSLIVGRTLGSAFPPKTRGDAGDINFAVESLSGRRFSDITFQAARGQIIGVAGVAGNGQSELMRALAGLQKSRGVGASQGTYARPQIPCGRGRVHAVGSPFRRAGEQPECSRERDLRVAEQVRDLRHSESQVVRIGAGFDDLSRVGRQGAWHWRRRYFRCRAAISRRS